ncbi:hypothetical protein [Streptomyces scabichelini]|uniref:hypothetical protein n=1 Tax=Streptomyces scabichelini TaxID=2711217 RepID=UPI0030BA2253
MLIKNEDPDKARSFPKGTVFRSTAGVEYRPAGVRGVHGDAWQEVEGGHRGDRTVQPPRAGRPVGVPAAHGRECEPP